MKTCPTRLTHRERASTLIEMIVYMALFVIVVGCATKTFFECWDNTKALRKSADDIARALDIGERWRADVRGATGSIQLTASEGGERLRIHEVAGEVIYTFANGELRRQAGSTAAATVWLSGVESSQMKSDVHAPVAVWRWELELKRTRKQDRVRPLFTFETAVRTAAIQ